MRWWRARVGDKTTLFWHFNYTQYMERGERDESSFIFHWHSHCTSHTGKKLLFKIEDARKWKMHIWSNRMSKLLRKSFLSIQVQNTGSEDSWIMFDLSLCSSSLNSEDLIQLWHINIKGVPVIYQINFAPLQSIIQWVLWKYRRKFFRKWKTLKVILLSQEWWQVKVFNVL